ncbi:MAG: hypothetical protein QNK11_07400 [Legionella sp.]|nr:hypothetical protein [Legionella sp.]
MDWVVFCNRYSASRFFLAAKATYLSLRQWLWKRHAAPDFQVASLERSAETQEYLVTLKNNHQHVILEKESASTISKNKVFIKKLSSEDANRIGYMAGLNDALKEARF